MNITRLPETLTRPQVEALRNAFGYFYDQGKISNFKDPKTKISFEKPENLIDELWRLGIPKDTSIKYIGITLENWYETVTSAPEFSEPTMSGAPESPVQANMPTNLDQLKKEEEIRSAKLKETQTQAETEVRAAIERQKEIYAEEIQKAKEVETALKDKKIYYKVEKPPVEETQEVKNLKQQAEADPGKFIRDATEQFQNNPNLKNISPEEARIAAEQAAITTYETLVDADNSPTIQITIATNAVGPEILNKIAPDIETQTKFKNILEAFIDQEKAKLQLTNNFIDLSKAGGVTGLENVTIKFSETPQEGYKEFDPITPHLKNLNQQNLLLNSLRGFGEHEIKSQFLSAAASKLESYIAGLPPNGLLAQAYNSEAVQLGLASLGLAEIAPWVAVEGSLFGKIVVGSGFAPLAGFIQTKTGIDLGVKIAANIGAKVITTAVGATTGAEGAVAAGAATGVALGGGIFSWVTAAIGAFVGWVATKIPWGKVKEWSAGILGFFAALIALPFAGLGAAIGIGAGTTVISMTLGGGLGGTTLGGIGSGIAGFFGAIGGAFIGAVATPILIVLLGFPVAVALILFIINSGAYVVPPSEGSLSSTNPYIDVQKIANPSGSVPSPTAITYTVTITAKKDTLTGISFTNGCQEIKKSGIKTDCKNLEQVPAPPDSISPAQPFSFTFKSDYGENFQNSLVSDNITVNAKSESGGSVSETGSASVCFGQCPLDCFQTVDNGEAWPSNLKANLNSAAATLASTYPNFAAKVCAAGTINLCYTTQNPSPIGTGGLCNQSFFADHVHTSNCDINFNQCGLQSQSDSLYILTHESTHHIQSINGSYQQKFDDQVPQSEWTLCTYNITMGNDAESMAEGDALFVGKPSWSGCIINYITQYPYHYKFAKNVMFAP